jgi:hypothetical protein
MVRCFIFLFNISFLFQQGEFYLPVKTDNRKDPAQLQLTGIGKFGIMRKAREKIPAHYHTGIDIKRPSDNYENEPVYPVLKGKVLSKRTDGAYAQLIIEHSENGEQLWTLYEHISGILPNVGDQVTPLKPVARFMNRAELDKYGWQFDHFHLEILKVKPLKLAPDKKNPDRHFTSYTLTCYTIDELLKYYEDPGRFLKEKMRAEKN